MPSPWTRCWPNSARASSPRPPACSTRGRDRAGEALVSRIDPVDSSPMPEDWTTGSAKWAAVLVLGGASIFGIAWSVLTRGPHAGAPATPAVVRIAPPADPEAGGEPQADGTDPAPPGAPAVAKRININT